MNYWWQAISCLYIASLFFSCTYWLQFSPAIAHIFNQTTSLQFLSIIVKTLCILLLTGFKSNVGKCSFLQILWFTVKLQAGRGRLRVKVVITKLPLLPVLRPDKQKARVTDCLSNIDFYRVTVTHCHTLFHCCFETVAIQFTSNSSCCCHKFTDVL